MRGRSRSHVHEATSDTYIDTATGERVVKATGARFHPNDNVSMENYLAKLKTPKPASGQGATVSKGDEAKRAKKRPRQEPTRGEPGNPFGLVSADNARPH